MTKSGPSTQSSGVAVIGAGYWGKNLVRVFHELGALRVVCDVDRTSVDKLQRQYGGVQVTQDVDAVIDTEDLAAVVIATPAESHYEIARKALLMGKDVFVEKPLALTVSEGDELLRLASVQRRILMVGHLLLYHPAILKLTEIVNRGELGRIQYVYSNRLNLGKIRREENILWSFAPHDVSVILMLLREMPREVSAHGGCYLHDDIADVTMSSFSFSSGVRAHIFVSWLHPYKEQKLIVVGDRQMAVFDDMEDTQKLRLYPHRMNWVNRVPVPRKEEAVDVPVTLVEPLKEECKAFLEAIVSRESPRSDARNGLDVLRVLEACQRSLEYGGNVVAVNGQAKAYPSSLFVHPTSTIDQPCEIGEGTKVWHYSHIMSGARIGRNCTIGQNVMIAPSVTVGHNVKIQNNVAVYSGVVIEDDVFCGPSMVFTNVKTPRSAVSRKNEFLPTVVKKGATLGANCTIVCGHSIGRYAFVGAGAVVLKDIPDYAMVVGNPARIIGWACECGVRLVFNDERAACRECGKQYLVKSDGIVCSQRDGTVRESSC